MDFGRGQKGSSERVSCAEEIVRLESRSVMHAKHRHEKTFLEAQWEDTAEEF